MIIKELVMEKEIREAFKIMKQLRTHLNEESYLELVKDAQENDHYHLYALYDHENIVAVAGFKPMITLYYGRFVWVCDLVTDENARSQGYGAKLLSYIELWAQERSYSTIALSSGLQRTDAHRFYEKRKNYKKVSYVFKKDI